MMFEEDHESEMYVQDLMHNDQLISPNLFLSPFWWICVSN